MQTSPFFINKKNTKLYWVFYLAIALIFNQGAQLHFHIYDHDHDYNRGHLNEFSKSDHKHADAVHFAHESSDAGHSYEVVSAVDISYDGFLNKLLFGLTFIAFFVTAIVLLLPQFYSYIKRQRHRDTQLLIRRHSIRHPLRAPPL